MTIYFIQPEGEPFVKIGHAATNVISRFSSLQSGNHRRLKLIGTMAGGLADEKRLHRKFVAAHHQGEWFHLTSEIVKFIGPQKNNQDIAHIEFYRDAYPNPIKTALKANGRQVGAPVKFDAKLQAKARKLLKMVEKRTLSKKDPAGKPIVVTRPVYSKIEIAAMCGISVATLHTWISQQRK